jgi:AhpD family alkylhydroperoxidase
MSAMRDVEWEACSLEPLHDATLEGWVRRELGMVPPPVPYLTTCPWLVRSFVALSPLSARFPCSQLYDLIGLVVSQDNSCRFCFAAQRALLRIQGLPERRIRQLEDDLLAAELAPHERAALVFARRLSRASPLLSPADLDPLRDVGYGVAEIKELAVVAAAAVYYNRVATLPAIPPERLESMPDRWWVRLLAPLMRRRLRAYARPGRPEPLPPTARQGPFAPFVLALEGLPAARALRSIVDDAFASPVLGARAKALVFAVVARGLDCPLSEREATRLLGEHGLDAPEVAAILAHLASPRLDPLEAALLPLARETIRYRPAQIQRRSRAFLERFGPEAFVEFIGVAALANAVCRLGVLTELRE